MEPMTSAALTTPNTDAAMAPDAVEPKRRAENGEASSSARSFFRSVTRPWCGVLGPFDWAADGLRAESDLLWRKPRGRRWRLGRLAAEPGREGAGGANMRSRSAQMASAAAWSEAISEGDPTLAKTAAVSAG